MKHLIPHHLKSILNPIDNNYIEHPAHVMGGSCICFAKGNPMRLTIQDLIDSLIPCIVATHLKVPVYLYFQSYESDQMQDVLKFDAGKSDYTTMKAYLLKGLDVVLDALDIELPEIKFIDTAECAISSLVSEIAEIVKKGLSKQELYGLYSGDSGKEYPKDSPEEDLMLDIYYRNLALYHPDFVTQITGRGEHYLLVENETQQKALKLIHKKFGEKRFSIMNYRSPQNRQAKEMCMGNRNHKIELRSSNQQIEERSDFRHVPEVQRFYETIFNKISIKKIMTDWIKITNEV